MTATQLAAVIAVCVTFIICALLWAAVKIGKRP